MNRIKQTKCYPLLSSIFNSLFPIRGGRNRVEKKGIINKAKIRIKGNNNLISFGKESIVYDIPITLRGNNCVIEIQDGVKILNRHRMCDILCEGNNVHIVIGKNTTIQSTHINAQEDDSQLLIGENCMFSEDIIIRTSDSHSILDSISNKRINPAKNVIIGNHVWISARACILKGVTINDNSIVGVGSIVTQDVPANSIVAGIPARVIKNHINWNSKLL